MDRLRVIELFEQAIEITPEHLAPWLAETCGDDAALRAELERLLRADAKAAHFMETLPALVAAAVASAASASSEMPKTFGVYRVLRAIGVGGMGEVWLAARSDGEFEQRVAIKQLAYPTAGLLQRFRQERQILARLEHPNIARLIDGGVDTGGAPYLVMEYVDGVPITDYVREHALDLRPRLHLFLGVCEAVRYAHQNLVVHRDLKPSNIFVTAEGLPKLLDFGIAKVLAATDQAAATQTVMRLLTPDYAAPEQFHGGAITTATDVYALGVVLYELLADTRPQRSMSSDANPALATFAPPPSAAINRAIGNAGARRRALRGDLDRIVLTALATDPQHRYSSAEALANDIRCYLDGRPIAARGDRTWYRLRKFVRRNRYVLGAAVIVFAVCLTATIVSLHQAHIARDQAQRADAVRQFLVGVFQQANPDENKGQPISAHQLLEKGEQQIEGSFKNQPALEADVIALLVTLYSSLGDYTRLGPLHARALALSEDPRVPDDVRGHMLADVADVVVEGKFATSLAQAQRALALLEVEPERSAQDIAKVHGIIGRNLAILGDSSSAVALLHKTLPQDEALLGDHNEMVGYEWAYLSRALRKRKRYDDAAAAIGRAQAIFGHIYGDNSNRVAILIDEAGDLYSATGDYARAEEAYRKTLNIYLNSLDPKHSSILWVRSDLLGTIESSGRYIEALPQRLAMLEESDISTNIDPLLKSTQYSCVGIDYRELGRFDEARSMLEQALALTAQSEGPRSANSLSMRQDLGTVLQLQGLYAQSDVVFGEALAASLEQGSNTSYEACRFRHEIGQNLRLEHRYIEAIEQLQALTRDACMPPGNDTDIWPPQVLATLSEAQLDAGDAATASNTADTAMTYARKAFSPRHFRLGIPLFAQARSKLALKKSSEAEALLREALALRSPPHPAADPRVLEVKTALVNALDAQGKTDEARMLRAEIEPVLKASSSPYATDLLARLAVAQ